ncbi:hypothetical protein SDC9_167846 [bioreactor metagenome]|uniref:Uncharacterized protein n=1 Tax=bioreactor metagenome TaxID=1076179 RepID=A0A645G0V9_9ZZZZ
MERLDLELMGQSQSIPRSFEIGPERLAFGILAEIHIRGAMEENIIRAVGDDFSGRKIGNISFNDLHMRKHFFRKFIC